MQGLRTTAIFLVLFFIGQAAYASGQQQPVVADASLCKPVCVSAREQCRSQVQTATENDTQPLLLMKPSTNVYANAAKEVKTEAQQLRPTEEQAFRARRAERLQSCEVQYRTCTRSCNQ